MMMVILIVDGELMDVIEMMVDNQADLVVHMEVDDVTKELQEMDWEQDEGLERAPMMIMVILIEKMTAIYWFIPDQKNRYSSTKE